MHWKKKLSHFDLKSWVAGGTKILQLLGIPVTQLFRSKWLIFSFFFQLFRSKWLIFFFQCTTDKPSFPFTLSICDSGLGHFGRGHLGRGHYGRGHLGRGHYGRGHFGRGHLGRGHFGPLI